MELQSSITADNIMERRYTLDQALSVLPNNLCGLFGEFYFTDGPDGDEGDVYYINEQGDINEMILMHIRDCLDTTRNRVNEMVSWAKIIMNVCPGMGFEEFEESPKWQEFKSDYPQVGKMLLVWGWS